MRFNYTVPALLFLLLPLAARATTPLPVDSTTTVTKPLIQFYPTVSISGSDARTVFWDNQPPAEVWYYNSPAGNGGLVTSAQREPKHPDHQKDWVAYEDTSYGVVAEITLKDLVAGTETRITNNTKEDFFPSVAGDRLAWQKNQGTHLAPAWDFVYKLSGQPEKVKGSVCGAQDCDETRPQIWDAYVVYNRTAPGSNDIDVYMYDMVANLFSPVAAFAPGGGAGYTDAWPHIWDNRVVFQSDHLNLNHPDIYYRNIAAGTLGGETPLLTPDPPVCAGYFYRPRVGGDAGRYTIFRALNCSEGGVNYGQALYLTYVTSTGVQYLYFVAPLAASHPDSEPTEYDLFGDKVAYSDGANIVIVDINVGALPAY